MRRNYEEAIVNFERAIELGGERVEYYYELGLSYAYLDQCDQARPWLEEALAIDPQSLPALQGLELCPPPE